MGESSCGPAPSLTEGARLKMGVEGAGRQDVVLPDAPLLIFFSFGHAFILGCFFLLIALYIHSWPI